MMNISLKLTLFFICVTIHSGWAQSAAEEKAVLDVVHRFFDALEKQDTVVMNRLYLTTAYNYYVREQNGVVRAGGRPHANTGLKPGQVVKERMRSSGVSVKIHNRIAMVWAPYDFWDNDQFSHCGVDVFTLIKDSEAWKIASLGFTVEKEDCK